MISVSLRFISYFVSKNDKRSTTCYIFTLVKTPICWKSMFQSLVALSINESKYMAVVEAAKETLWLTGLVKKLGI